MTKALPIIPEAVEVPYAERAPDQEWWETRSGTILLLCGAMLFLGIPLLWRNPRFTNLGRIVWTLVVLLESFLIFWGFYEAMAWSFHMLQAK